MQGNQLHSAIAFLLFLTFARAISHDLLTRDIVWIAWLNLSIPELNNIAFSTVKIILNVQFCLLLSPICHQDKYSRYVFHYWCVLKTWDENIIDAHPVTKMVPDYFSYPCYIIPMNPVLGGFLLTSPHPSPWILHKYWDFLPFVSTVRSTWDKFIITNFFVKK